MPSSLPIAPADPGFVEEAGATGEIDPEVSAWALMAAGEMLGMRWILWGDGHVPDHVTAELARIVRCVLETR